MKTGVPFLASQCRSISAIFFAESSKTRSTAGRSDAGVKAKYDALIADGLVPQRRWGTPEDVGRAVRAILAGAFPFSTGEVIYLDGGFHISRL